MRNILSGLSHYLVAASALAQPTLSHEALPVTGTVYGYHDVPYLKPGNPGEGLRWDFSSLPIGTIIPYVWATTDIAPGAGAFPSTSMVRQVPGEPASYFQRTDTGLLWIGTYSDTALLRFDPPMRELALPCSMNDQWTDTGIVAVTGAGRIGIYKVRHSVKADAWGTLLMPYGVVENVLRVRSEWDLLDRRYLKYPVRREVRYSWYSDRTPMPLLVITERAGWAPPDRILRWLDGSWRDDPIRLFQPIRLVAFPDPCDDMVTIDLPAARADRTILQLVDGMGNSARQWPVEFTSPETRRLVLEMNGVPAGSYTLTWTGTNGTLGNARLTKR